MALVLAVLVVATADASIRSPSSSTRSCGTLSLGIGWHLAATPDVTCTSARQLMAAYFKRRGNRQERVVVDCYVCTRRDVPDAEHISCSRAARLVAVRSFGY